LQRLGHYLLSAEESLQQAKEEAAAENPWFIPEFIDTALHNIARLYLQEELLWQWVNAYDVPDVNIRPRSVGIVMAGNIPLVGFHDFLSVFISGHQALIKLSSKDKVLLKRLADKLFEWEPATARFISFADQLKGCDAYIATGSNTSSRYFQYYFKKYPHIIRHNKTSVAVLTGNETPAELEKLADDILLYFGLGCRNVSKIFVPEQYDFVSLLRAFEKYQFVKDHHRYKNNYDYNLALHILNKKFYMTNGVLLLSENASPFSPISQLNYSYYARRPELLKSLSGHPDLQCIVARDYVPFGQSQMPALHDYADGTDTLRFLLGL
jgi:hypothetical protein